MPAPILHLIYAGRGDAMILECDDDLGMVPVRQFILVDGGPRNYHSGNGAGSAPYNRYLLSACNDLLPPNTGLTGVIISHPDEDHYGGYTFNLQQQQMAQPPMLCIPNNASAATNDNMPVQKHLLGPTRRIGFLPDTDAFLIRPVKAIFPPRAQIRYYYDVNNGRPGNVNGELTTDTTTNGRSILMYTTTGQAREMGIFFTGDSHADIIAREMRRVFPTLADRRFAVYKIQHHGSIYDNQLEFYNPMFMYSIQYECFIYCLLKVYNDAGYLATPRRTDRPSGWRRKCSSGSSGRSSRRRRTTGRTRPRSTTT